jgi:hypothetical protein
MCALIAVAKRRARSEEEDAKMAKAQALRAEPDIEEKSFHQEESAKPLAFMAEEYMYTDQNSLPKEELAQPQALTSEVYMGENSLQKEELANAQAPMAGSHDEVHDNALNVEKGKEHEQPGQEPTEKPSNSQDETSLFNLVNPI